MWMSCTRLNLSQDLWCRDESPRGKTVVSTYDGLLGIATQVFFLLYT